MVISVLKDNITKLVFEVFSISSFFNQQAQGRKSVHGENTYCHKPGFRCYKSTKTITGSITTLLKYTLGFCSKNTKTPILYGLNGTLEIYFYHYTFLWCNKRGYISFFQWSIVNKWNVSTSSVLWIMRSLHEVWSKAKFCTLIHNQ